ncbi:LemA family protein [Micromonospora sp. WMMD1082]|uniref:LemA family protein n=1 Tax=Micromonospora sp. WMMD1082 TaxID=3016104 RepID=UPI002415E4EC|nr:LemA family protein [Micromonospora sp. WMMD1082]MDG4797152.1 LemA family protein [Micromonospora sp. WMMD1082]
MGRGVVVGVVGGLFCLLVTVAIGGALIAYNRLVRQRNQVRASWAQIDVQLKRRHDLVPNLVETVKGYAVHERGTLEAVVAARSGAIAAAGTADVADRAGAENALTRALGRLFALSEAYPDLKASENFAVLQGELARTEDRIAYARQFYNSAVQTFNTTVESIPTNLVAGLGGFRTVDFFGALDGERAAVQVRF